ncbi:MAG: hypothetical protein KY453_04735 [Gemmatimonadetes bacterium]|nr:hypothetical protein [Gemmatimonadota bacterium]
MARPSLPGLVLCSLFLAAGCSDARQDAGHAPLSFQSIHEAFTTLDTIHLEQVPGDTIAEIGAVDISADGDIVIADRYLPRVRLYARDGRFVAGQGRFGDAPFEYRRIRAVARDRSGRVVVLSLQAPRTTVLTPDLLPDTTIPLASGFIAPWLAQRFRGGVVQGLIGEEGRTWYSYQESLGTERWRIEAGPRKLYEVPYWASVARFLTDSAGDTLLLGNSFLYPVGLYDAGGALVGELGSPPPSWRDVPEVEAGAFAFTGPSDMPGGALAEWLTSFTVIAGLHVVQDRWLVVSHGRVSTERLTPPFETVEYAVDMYDLGSGTKVLEDVPLPQGARVLGGGPYLHVLTAIPPQPWTVVRLDILPEVRAAAS